MSAGSGQQKYPAQKQVNIYLNSHTGFVAAGQAKTVWATHMPEENFYEDYNKKVYN